MSNSEELNKDAEDLRQMLESNFLENYQLLIAFVEKYNVTDSIALRTILLGAEMTDSLTENSGISLSEEKKDALFNEALKIISIIQNEKKLSETSIRDVEVVRKAFINRAHSTTIYECDAISKNLGKFFLHPLSLTLKLGEITSVVGENGNGKSTLLKIIAGELSIDEGKRRYPTFSPDGLNWMSIKKEIAYIPQDFLQWSSASNRRKAIHFTAAAKGLTGVDNINAVNYIITRLGLKKFQDYPSEKLSSGYKLRFELARQLVWNPKLLIMDEPLAHLDIKAQRDFLDDLRNLTNSLKSPISVILSSQNLYEIEKVSDKVIFLNQGKPTYNGPVADIARYLGTNCFLLNVDHNLNTLSQILKPISNQIKEIKIDKDEIILTTSISVNSNSVLKLLAEANVTINYFRNISNSSRIFFDYEQN